MYYYTTSPESQPGAKTAPMLTLMAQHVDILRLRTGQIVVQAPEQGVSAIQTAAVKILENLGVRLSDI